MILQWVQAVEIVGKSTGLLKPKEQILQSLDQKSSHVTQGPFPMDL